MQDRPERLSTPEKDKVVRIFKNHYFQIPKYQRSYVWSDRGSGEQLMQFWDDFLDTEKSTGNLPFLGNLILSKTGKSETFDVVDGQQRLITLQILFRALQTKIVELGASDLPVYKNITDSLKNLIVSYDEYGLEESLKLVAAKDIDKYFRELMLTGKIAVIPFKKEPQWNMWNAYTFFQDKIDEFLVSGKTAENKIEMAVSLFKKIGEVQFIIITLGDQADAYEVFESFNAKGEKLNTSDLFKNLIFSKLDSSSNVNQAYEKWDQILENVKTINQYLPQFNVDAFLRYYWSATNGYTNPRGLYREIKDQTTNYQELINGLHKTSATLAILLDTDNLTPMIVSSTLSSSNDPQGKESNRIYGSLKGLNSLKIQQYLVWLICIIKNWKEIDNRRHLQINLSAIESFSVLYFTGSASSANKIEKIFCSLAKEMNVTLGKVEDKKITPRSKEALMLSAFPAYVKKHELMPSKEEFILDFSRFKYAPGKNRPNVFYLLSKLEQRRRSSQEMNIDSITTTIEHLLPQAPSPDWGLTSGEIKPYVDLIGNLTLLDLNINSSIKSGTPEKKVRSDNTDKKRYLDDSELKITQEIIDGWKQNNFTWNESLIRERQDRIAAELYEIFSPKLDV